MEKKSLAGSAMALRDYVQPLETVSPFKYLGRLLTADCDDCPYFIANLWKSRNIWSSLDWILGREGADTSKLGRFYIPIFQSVFLFVSDTWVVVPYIRRPLGVFQHRVERRLWGSVPQWRAYGTWEYPPLVGAKRSAGIKEIETYISR